MSRWIRIHNASRLLDPASGVDGPGEVWIRDGTIHAVQAAGEPAPADVGPGDALDVIDAGGALVTPMFVDIHVHFREPGGEEAETVASGVRAALRGGYALVYAMPNTSPTCDVPDVVEHVARAARAAGDVEVVPVSALSRGLRGRDLVDFEAMAAAGAGAFSDDGAWLADERLAREALRWTARNGRILMQHCEDFDVTGTGVLHACDCVHRAGYPGIDREAEDRAVRRDLRLAAEVGAPVHVCHVSTAGAVDAIRAARERGEPVTAEVTPHHLVLTAEDAVAGGPDFKMKPPLRESADAAALVDALADGTLQALATDHAPHAAARKAAGVLEAPFGAIGLETAFPVVYTRLVTSGRLPLERLVAALTSGPCAVVGRAPPRLAPGHPARLNAIDLETPRTVDREALVSGSRNCPFHGLALRGWPAVSVLESTVHVHVEGGVVRYRTNCTPDDDSGGSEGPPKFP
jgi:dihydroorotase